MSGYNSSIENIVFSCPFNIFVIFKFEFIIFIVSSLPQYPIFPFDKFLRQCTNIAFENIEFIF